jgi:esterase/lipase
MMLAEKEYLVGNSGAKVFHAKSGSTHKQLIEFKGSFHELQKEPNKDDV